MNTSTKTTSQASSYEASHGKLPLRSKICYGLGDTANGFIWNFIASYLMIFCTDVFGVTAMAVSVLLLVSRLWDAINDPVVGMLADRTRSRFGRYRIWIIGGIIPLVLCSILVFWAHPDWPQGAKIAYMFVTYGLTVLAYTVINIPYTALAAVMTQDPQERSSLAGFRMALALVGAIVSAQCGARLVPVLSTGDSQARGYLLTMLILALAAIPLYLLTFANTKEVVQPSPATKSASFGSQIRNVWKNKPLVLVLVVHFAVGMTIYGRMAAVPYFFKYNMGVAEAAGTFFLCMQIPMMIGSVVSPYFTNRFQSKGKILSATFIIYGILSVANVFFTLETPFLFWGVLVAANLFYGVGYAVSYAVIPDTIEYGQYLTGVRNDGFTSSMTTFWNKVGMAIGTSATAAILGILSYNPNGAQTSATLTAISSITYIVPGIAAIIVGIVFLAYKLDYRTFNKIVEKLHAQETAAPEQPTQER